MDLLPPPKPISKYERSKYVIIPSDLYKELEIEAAKRGYKTREFVIQILRTAMGSATRLSTRL